jgi:hypothetical protein
MQRSALKMSFTLVMAEGVFDTQAAKYKAATAVIDYFASNTSGYTYSLTAMAGAIQSATDGAVNEVIWGGPSSDVTLTPLPAVLTKYSLDARDITIQIG